MATVTSRSDFRAPPKSRNIYLWLQNDNRKCYRKEETDWQIVRRIISKDFPEKRGFNLLFEGMEMKMRSTWKGKKPRKGMTAGKVPPSA